MLFLMDTLIRVKLHERAKAYGLIRLQNEIGLSRQALYLFFSGGDMRLSNFEKLLRALHCDIKIEPPKLLKSDVLGNLKRHGAPLLVESWNVALSLEESIQLALQLSRSESRLSSVLPYLLVRSTYKLDHKKLISKISNSMEFQLLGYYLELALQFHYRKPLEQLSRSVRRRANKLTPLYLRERDEGKAADKFERFKNNSAIKWKILTRDTQENLLERCHKWEKLAEAS